MSRFIKEWCHDCKAMRFPGDCAHVQTFTRMGKRKDSGKPRCIRCGSTKKVKILEVTGRVQIAPCSLCPRCTRNTIDEIGGEGTYDKLTTNKKEI